MGDIMGFFDKLKKIVKKEETVFEDDNQKEKYEKGLEKTRKEFSDKLKNLNKKYKKVNEEYFEELEELLIMADIGVDTVIKFMDKIVTRAKKEKIDDPEVLQELIVDELFIIYVNDEILVNKINYNDNGPTVILFVGVNGVGKTTTIAKIGKREKEAGKKVMFVAGDTFRAGAIEQLEEWGDRLGIKTISSEENSDPSSVIYKALEEAKRDSYDVVLVDTAGRLQNKVNLMKELEKINKVIGKLVEGGPSETLLVLDATTGQNGISQAKNFKEITNITGIVLTKLDGTAKGGIVLAIKDEINIPVKYIGLGETADDLEPFDIEKYIYGLFKELIK